MNGIPSANAPKLALSLLIGCVVLCPTAVMGQKSPRVTAAPSDQAAERLGFSTDRLERVDKNIQGYVDRNEVAGVVALIARRGSVVYHKSFGQRDAEAGMPMTEDTIFRIASMTKPIASVALMQLWEQGHFQLRDPISKFLPEFSDMKVVVQPGDDEYVRTPMKLVQAERPITFQHILTHTAGLPNAYRGPTQAMYQQLRSRRKPGDTVGDYVKELAKLPLNFQPGDRWEYGPATDVVGRLVEVISDQSLDEYLQQHILEPLDMRDTHFYLPTEKLPRFAANYAPDANGKFSLTEAPNQESRYVRQPHTYFSGAGGLVSTTRDYFLFHQMMLNGGVLNGNRILGPKTIDLMTVNHIGDKGIWLRGPGYGFGLGYSVVDDLGQSAMPASLGSYSWGGAFCTVFWVDPTEDLIGVLMTQIRPYTHINIRQDFQTLVYQAIID